MWKYLLENEIKVQLSAYSSKKDGFTKGITGLATKITQLETDKRKKQSEIRALEKNTTSIQPTIDAINSLLKSFAVAWSSPPMAAGFGFARPSVVPRRPRDATAIARTGASPKLLIIYVVDEKGQMDREFLAVIDGTLGGPDAIFKLLEFYLRELKISTADKILFVADGARWIWNRSEHAAAVGGQTGPGERVGGLLSCGGASGQDRGLAAPLDGGGASGVDRSPAAAPAERRSRGGASGDRCRVWFSPRQGVETGCEYFKRNGGRGRMDYARIAALKLPIGSGAIESAIRRVVNLRLKGPSIYWHKTTAEAVLLLRSYYKAGRWNHLERQAFTTTTGIAT